MLFWAALSLVACTTLQGGGSDRYWLKDNSLSMDDAVSLLHYASYARALSASERERELDKQKSSYAKDKSDFHRLQYALVLSTPGASVSERKQALQLADSFPDGSDHDAGLSALAALLASQLQMQTQGQQQVQKRVDELEKKLEAVKDIERSLLHREKGKP
jgi:hypothetical protein